MTITVEQDHCTAAHVDNWIFAVHNDQPLPPIDCDNPPTDNNMGIGDVIFWALNKFAEMHGARNRDASNPE